MSFFDTIMSDTVGVVWRASSGTVDPWTKNNQIEAGAQAEIQASGGSETVQQATDSQKQIITDSLTSEGSDPSQFKVGLKYSLDEFLKKIKELQNNETTLILVIGGVAVAVLLAFHLAERDVA